MGFFDFLQWALSDFWRFAGLLAQVLACGVLVPSYRSERKVVGSAETEKKAVMK